MHRNQAHKEVLEAVTHLRSFKHPEVRREVDRELAGLLTQTHVLKLAGNFINDDRYRLQLAGLQVLSKLHPVLGMPRLPRIVHRLESPMPEVRKASAELLQKMHPHMSAHQREGVLEVIHNALEKAPARSSEHRVLDAARKRFIEEKEKHSK